MRRPRQTAAQRAHAREQRALLVLRRAAVRLTNHCDDQPNFDLGVEAELSFALEAAAFKYANALPARARRKLAR